MFGWLITNYTKIIELNNQMNADIIKYCDFTIIRSHNGRFINDTIFDETEEYIIVIDGMVFNKSDLIKESGKSWYETVLELYKISPQSLPSKLRGSFSGLIIDKQTKSIFAFTNHIGDSGVFYSVDEKENKFVISTNFGWISEILTSNRVTYALCDNAVKYMCTFGFMLDNSTFIDKIHRLLPGEYISLDKCIKIDNYHVITNTKTIDLSDQEIIDKIDYLFRQAINREFGKDEEYGYTSVVDLSGGLDSRVVNYVAKDLGYNNVINVSFSQTNSDEYKAMIALHKDLGNPLFFVPLDNAKHLFDIDKIVAGNYGLSFYAGAGGLITVMENLNPKIHGMEHGGVLGEMADGVFPGSDYTKHTQATFETGMPFCRMVPLSILDKQLLEKYPNTELFTIYGRGLLGGACPQLIRRNYTGYFSAFEDIDFYDFFLSIPLDIRGGKKILQKWVNQKYPQAFNIIEDKLMCKPNASRVTKAEKKFKRKVKGKIGDYFGNYFPVLLKNSMNPMEYWYSTNSELRDFIDDYYNVNIDKLKKYPNEYALVDDLFRKGTIKEKLIVLTILSVMKQYFNEG